MPSIVALDLETTGLDPRTDDIIEIGAVRFNGHRIEDEWSTLVNPRRSIPTIVTQLTGITNEMVRNAPHIDDVLPEFAEFVGNSPVLGHNVRFDLSFLQRYGLFQFNDWMDTYELAAILMPTASRYNLGALGQITGIALPADHRALDDARVTHALFLKLYEKAQHLPVDLLKELIRLGEPFDWGAAWPFNHLIAKKGGQPGGRATRLMFELPAAPPQPPLMPNDPLLPLDVEEAAALLEYGGSFASYFESYEMRPQQVEMLRAVAQALSDGQHLLVEAGTGTGKSIAYLIPAALWAMRNGTRVVISTNTINLQDQLIKKDIPDLRRALNIDLQATVLKGRSNYLCPRRLEALRMRTPETVEQVRVLAKVLVWLAEGGSGDRTEINLNGPVEREAWSRISADDEGCKAEVCMSRTGGACPFFQARQSAQSSHLVIVNHALLLSDIATGNRVLPDYQYLIVDEAHQIESATTGSLSYRLTRGDVDRLLHLIGGTSSGLLAHMLTFVRGVARPSDFATFHQMVTRATDLIFRMENNVSQLFESVQSFLAEQRGGQAIGTYTQQERITPSVRTQPGWTEVEIAWDQTHDTLQLLNNLLGEIFKASGELAVMEDEELEDMRTSLSDILRRMGEMDTNLARMIATPNAFDIYWAEISPNGGQIALQIAPLNVGPLMERYLWHEKASVILTSATMTANGEFDYIRQRLNADEANELALGSPFDYETSAMLYLVNDIPEPSDAQRYQRAVEDAIIRLSKATGGRMLVLFTSYAQLKRTSQIISPELAKVDIQVYEQGEGASSNTLLETFKESERAVLLGTRAFWEGVDIPGDALSVLVIAKLPFDVPSDPVVAARSETFEDPFSEYSIPEAILRFRQGFGRLIRTASDRGIVVILDKRLLSKRYGKMFINSLPECNMRTGSLADLPRTAQQWLNL